MKTVVSVRESHLLPGIRTKKGVPKSEEQAKKQFVVINRIVLGCDFEALEYYDSADVFSIPKESKYVFVPAGYSWDDGIAPHL
jgi:hypothetical protein